MSHSKERVAAILQALTANLPNILERATQIAIRDSLPTQLLVQELESHGYQLDATLDCTFLAIPVELIFERSLTNEDRAFLRLADHSEEKSTGMSPAPGRNDTLSTSDL